MSSHTALPSRMINAIPVSASPNRTQTGSRLDSSTRAFESYDSHQVSFADSAFVSTINRNGGIGHAASSPSGQVPEEQCHSPPVALHPYYGSSAHGQGFHGHQSHSQNLDSYSPASPGTAVTPRLSQNRDHILGFASQPGSEGASTLGPAASTDFRQARSSAEASLSFASTAHQIASPDSSSLRSLAHHIPQSIGLDDCLSPLTSAHLPGVVGAQGSGSRSHIGLSPSFGPRPTLVSPSAPPTSAVVGSTPFHKSVPGLPATSIGSSSASPFARTVPPPCLSSTSCQTGVSGLSSVAPAHSHGAVSPLYLGAGVASLPALSRSVSDDATYAPSASNDTTESLRQQLSFLLQSWMADRQSGRMVKLQTEQEMHRARSAMDSEREQWLSDRAALERHLESLRAQIFHLQEENAILKACANRKGKDTGALSPSGGQQQGRGLSAQAGNACLSDSEDHAAVSLSSNPSQQSASSRAYIFSPPPGSEGAIRRHHVATPGSSRTSPSGPPAPSHVTPLDPRSQPRHSALVDFMDPLAENTKMTAPIIDVREIDPRLEGIPIKANAVQRSTFDLGTSNSSLSVTHQNGPGGGVVPMRAARHSIATQSVLMDRDSRGRRMPRKESTLQALSAEESRRLTMHAGHTPNHSLSLLPTKVIAEGDSAGDDSTRNTPSAVTHLHGEDDTPCDTGLEAPDHIQKARVHSDRNSSGDIEELSEETALEPQDDVPLKGPLMVKNIPAQDDVFFARLDKKLESVVSGQDALPSVLRTQSHGGEDTEEVREPRHSPEQPRQPVPAPLIGADGLHDFGSARESDVGDESDNKDIEPEVPLKMRRTQNFGAPFGSM